MDFQQQFNLTMEDGKSCYWNEEVIESCCRRGFFTKSQYNKKAGNCWWDMSFLCQTVSPVSHKARHVILHWTGVHPVLWEPRFSFQTCWKCFEIFWRCIRKLRLQLKMLEKSVTLIQFDLSIYSYFLIFFKWGLWFCRQQRQYFIIVTWMLRVALLESLISYMIWLIFCSFLEKKVLNSALILTWAGLCEIALVTVVRAIFYP